MSTPGGAGQDDFGGQEPPSDDLFAAEYVLGVLDAGTRRAAQTRIAADRGFADLVLAWQRRLAPLALEVRPVEVPGRVWTRIQERLGWTLAAAGSDSGSSRRALRQPRLSRYLRSTSCPRGARRESAGAVRGATHQSGDHTVTRRWYARLACDRGCAPRHGADGAGSQCSGHAGAHPGAVVDTARSGAALARVRCPSIGRIRLRCRRRCAPT